MAYELSPVLNAIAWAFVGYVVFATLGYLVLNSIAYTTLRDYVRNRRVDVDLSLYTGLEPPITVVVPAFNEGMTIVSSIKSILQLHYPFLEVIIVNDGSNDNTLDALIKAFNFEPFDEAIRQKIETNTVKQVYMSRSINNLRLVDKENGGKADAINAGINICRSPMFCCVDADSVLEPTSLLRVVQPFMDNPDTVATGGTVRIANGCRVRYGTVVQKGIPTHLLSLFQLIEYLRAFLFGRLGWSRINGLLIVSGAFGVFRRDAVTEVGGYATGTIGEDMELIVRLHRRLPEFGKKGVIAFTPDPVCWTEAPERLRDFQGQRVRWHRGLSESLWMNRQLLFKPDGGTAGWIAFPFFMLVEWLSPFIELLGYIFTLYLVTMTDINLMHIAIVYAAAISISVCLSVIGFLMDEITFPGATRLRDILILMFFSVLECFGYRQLNMYYRIRGAVMWMFGAKSSWGSMSRTGGWQKGGQAA